MEQFIFIIYIAWVFIVPQIITHISRSIGNEDTDAGNVLLAIGTLIYGALTIAFTFALINWNILIIST